MAPASPRLRVLSVGGNALSAFMSWRLQATRACDVTLVWKSSYDSVAQYGISFKSTKFGNERFKPHSVVRSPEDASTLGGGFDYVLLSVKALPDVYDLAAIIESVVTPQQTCIIINTTSATGTEAYLESRYPTNVILSLVSGVQLNQLGTSDFEHTGGADIWVGSAVDNSNIPAGLANDMAEALALTLTSGEVECHVSPNIRQQQWERVLGPIAFHPLSVIMESPNLSALMEKTGCKQLIPSVIDELMSVAKAQGCSFPDDFKQKTIDEQLKAPASSNIMHQDYTSRRPLEVETFLGSPIKAGQALGVPTPHLSTLYAILHHMNQANQNRPAPVSPAASVAPPTAHAMPPPSRNGMPPNRRPGTASGPGPGYNGPPPRRGPPPVNGNGRGGPNGYGPRMNGDGPRQAVSRRGSFDNDLEEFGHIALYGDMVDSDVVAMAAQGEGPYPARNGGMNGAPPNELSIRERELALREREAMLREQEMHGGRKSNARRRMPKMGGRARSVYGEDDDDEDDFYEPAPPPMPPIDVDKFDMMSMTSQRTRRGPRTNNMRRDPEVPMQQPMRGGRHSMFSRPGPRSRASTRMMTDVPGLHESLMDNSLMGYSSNRYGAVDRKEITTASRANSMTSNAPDFRNDPAFGNAYPPMPQGRRMSNSPGAPNGYGPRPGNSPNSPNPNGVPNGVPNGMSNGFPPSPGSGQPIRSPMPKHPPGELQVEQHLADGVSQSRMPKGPPSNTVRSTTGSASASLSNDSGSVSTGDQSAYSSTSSLDKRVPSVAVR